LKTAPLIRIALVAFALAATAAPPRARAATLEYPVKAAFLYKFAPFVEWPPRAFGTGAAPLTLCVVGFDPFGATLDKAIDGQRVGARPLVARRMETIGAGSGCHIAYLGGSKAQSVSDGLAALQGAPVLTVTDQSMGSARGAVHFVIKDNRVRFHIDDADAAAHGVSISSKLLRLALSVRLRKGGRA
jgi:tRNA threonylcarbamoyladenosine modification (KEOPS) complex  Pcc1 subunit